MTFYISLQHNIIMMLYIHTYILHTLELIISTKLGIEMAVEPGTEFMRSAAGNLQVGGVGGCGFI